MSSRAVKTRGGSSMGWGEKKNCFFLQIGAMRIARATPTVVLTTTSRDGHLLVSRRRIVWHPPGLPRARAAHASGSFATRGRASTHRRAARVRISQEYAMARMFPASGAFPVEIGKRFWGALAKKVSRDTMSGQDSGSEVPARISSVLATRHAARPCLLPVANTWC